MKTFFYNKYVILLLFSIILILGFSFGLLIPLIKGVIDKDFSFLSEIGMCKIIINWFPQLFAQSPNTFLFLVLVITIFSVAIVKNIIRYFLRVFVSKKREEYLFNLQTSIFDRMLGFGKLYFDKTSQGYMERIMTFAKSSMSLITLSGDSLMKVGTLIFYLIIMIRIDWRLTLFSFAIFLTPPPFPHPTSRNVNGLSNDILCKNFETLFTCSVSINSALPF